MENGHAKYRVAVIGSGNWGSVASRLIASNTAKLPSFYDKIAFILSYPFVGSLATCTTFLYLSSTDLDVLSIMDFVDEVRMWVFEEILPTGNKLSESINRENENCKYLPGIKLGPNVIADPDLESAVKDANMLVFVTPHQFVEGICKKLVGKLRPGAQAISLIKGMEVEDIEGVELCGTLKNIVAIAAGLVDGLDMGNNTKAAIMRIGLREMRAFSKLLFPSVRDNTFFESCGVADLITTCLGGRNRRVAEAFARNGGKRSFDELEAEMLHGQKLQGVSTAAEVYEVLTYRGWQELFPLLSTVHEICIGQLPPTSIVEYSEHTPNLSIIGGPTPCY
ncbi:hypothetical protein PR202_ga08174 [Eleusine coracana subsp. coracana]|uniref:glycerol-3-phosphate dehydrogenase (NAD(+)) n=1 Tax=Eleusine coracana subsp. coracana TaxID=191504 RepID=A0AAV5C2H9_ELECO|nr:hypothetical protein PR202_ga08174 [Eleusine coracana subsp. coracana]